MEKRFTWLSLVSLFFAFFLICLAGIYVSLQEGREEGMKIGRQEGRNEVREKPVVLKIFTQEGVQMIKLIPAYDDEKGNRIFILPPTEISSLGGFSLRPSKQD